MTMTPRDDALMEKIPQMAKLVRIVPSMPLSTTICKRGFSAQNVVKTIKRTRLNDHSLEGLFRIATNGPPPEQMDHSAAVLGGLRTNKRTEEKCVKPKKVAQSADGAELGEDLEAIPVDMEANRLFYSGFRRKA